MGFWNLFQIRILKMKPIITLILLATSLLSFAQTYVDTYDPDDQKVKSLLSNDNDINGFGGSDLKVGEFFGERGLLVGAYGGLLIDRRYLFGLAGYGIVTNIQFEGTIPDANETKTLTLHGGYGGIIFGPTIAPSELIHLSIPIVFGAGAFEIVDEDFFSSLLSDTEFVIENSIFFLVEPGLQVEFNISQSFRMGIGATYRYISGTDLINLSDEDVSGFAGILSFRFGRF